MSGAEDFILSDRARDTLSDFMKVAEIANQRIASNSIQIALLPAPHKPPSSLPAGKMAVYSFFWRERCLKVGKVGAKSQARYVSQHYIPASSRSNLARSLLSSLNWTENHKFSEETVGQWIRTNTSRINYLVPTEAGLSCLALLESFLQCRWSPEFEGKSL